ncbi:MAG TPA: hypothetical protein VF121_03035 [Thermoanaerobaculia bacterium]|nr:hypothetical protein [Thermoanaerobaculia bacterium]
MPPAGEPAVTNTLACPQCGGENVLASGERLLACPFCGATLFVDRSGLVSHYRLPRLLDRERAAAALRRWMAGNETVKDLDRKATVEEVAPVAFPMWLFRVRRERGEDVVVEPAAPTPVPQLADLEVPAGKLEPYAAEGGEVEEVGAGVPLATARGWIPGVAAASVGESALVHVPLWRCRYRFREQPYLAYVDGSTGAVLAAVFPAKSESPYYLVAGVGLLLFLAEGLLLSNLLVKAAAYIATALPLALLAWLVTRKV